VLPSATCVVVEMGESIISTREMCPECTTPTETWILEEYDTEIKACGCGYQIKEWRRFK
jgi:hypothetical protein